MKANTNQSSSFSDVTMEKIESDLDTINELVEWSGISNRLNQVKSDYSPWVYLRRWSCKRGISCLMRACRRRCDGT